MAKKYVKEELISLSKKHKILMMSASGYPYSKIAETLGVSEGTVVKVLNVSERS